jgi:hypothetical protein
MWLLLKLSTLATKSVTLEEKISRTSNKLAIKCLRNHAGTLLGI